MPWHQWGALGEVNAKTDDERQQDPERAVPGQEGELAQKGFHLGTVGPPQRTDAHAPGAAKEASVGAGIEFVNLNIRPRTQSACCTGTAEDAS